MSTSSAPFPPSLEELRAVSPALERYASECLLDDVWTRPELSTRDRCLITLAVIVAKGQTLSQRYYFDKALDNGVSAAELSELMTHLAFYTGWGNALAAVAPLKASFDAHGVSQERLPPARPTLLPLDTTAEAKRAAAVQANLGEVAPGVVMYTTDILFNDLWLRPDLAPRDRSLITVSALTATGQAAQITFHLNRAMDNGLTKAEAAEVFTHLAFYTGWPSVMSALTVAKDVFAARA
jgi:4-carboxymuconolactone decarboxylase